MTSLREKNQIDQINILTLYSAGVQTETVVAIYTKQHNQLSIPCMVRNSHICMSNILQGEFDGISGWKHQSEGKNLKVRTLLLALLFWGADLAVDVFMFFAASAWEPLLKYYYYDDVGLSTTEVSIFAVTMKLRPGKVK